jgi:hypothetical protein
MPSYATPAIQQDRATAARLANRRRDVAAASLASRGHGLAQHRRERTLDRELTDRRLLIRIGQAGQASAWAFVFGLDPGPYDDRHVNGVAA